MRILARANMAMMAVSALVALLLVLVLVAGTGARAETDMVSEVPAFLADLSDVPLAPGLLEVEGERLVFDKPEGRIVQAVATGKRPVSEIAGFYRETLPQLGWELLPATDAKEATPPDVEADRLVFARDLEQLEIRLETVYQTLVVRFSLEPRP